MRLDPASVARMQSDLLEFSAGSFGERRGGEFVRNWHQRRISDSSAYRRVLFKEVCKTPRTSLVGR